MDKLIEGYRRYRARRWPELKGLHQKLAEGQRPHIMVIACCDSRVDPATIFDAYPGELFVIRNIANLAPPYETGGGHHGVSAAIEFAVETLRVDIILVMGHAQCGGVQAALARDDAAPATTFLEDWVSLLAPAKARLAANPDDPQTALEHESVRVSLENLMSFPFVAERVAAGTLALAGAHYGVADGQLEILNPETGRFEALE